MSTGGFCLVSTPPPPGFRPCCHLTPQEVQAPTIRQYAVPSIEPRAHTLQGLTCQAQSGSPFRWFATDLGALQAAILGVGFDAPSQPVGGAAPSASDPEPGQKRRRASAGAGAGQALPPPVHAPLEHIYTSCTRGLEFLRGVETDQSRLSTATRHATASLVSLMRGERVQDDGQAAAAAAVPLATIDELSVATSPCVADLVRLLESRAAAFVSCANSLRRVAAAKPRQRLAAGIGAARPSGASRAGSKGRGPDTRGSGVPGCGMSGGGSAQVETGRRTPEVPALALSREGGSYGNGSWGSLGGSVPAPRYPMEQPVRGFQGTAATSVAMQPDRPLSG